MAGHRHGPGRIPEKPNNFKGTIGKLFRYLGRYRLGGRPHSVFLFERHGKI